MDEFTQVYAVHSDLLSFKRYEIYR